MAGPRILISAGEPSGDLHGAAVAEALLRRWPDARLFGLGGPRMAAAGVELMADFQELAVMGFAEVAGRLPFFVRLLRRLEAELRGGRADLLLPIDYPGFNLRLAARAHDARVPVLYYIAPQVWAWHRSRVGRLARVADRLAVILPFEEAIFREAGARVRFVGHPLLDAPPPETTGAELRAALGLGGGPILAVFPGSRAQEVEKHLPIFLDAAERVRAALPGAEPVVARASAVPAAAYRGVRFPLTDDSRALLAHARAALVKSGTTTLEAALAGTPMAIAYRTSAATFWLARRLVRVDHIGLVNLVAGERLMPELIQDDATPEALAEAILPLMRETPRRAAALAGLARVRGALAAPAGAPGDPARAADRVAALAAELLPEAR